MPYVIQEDRKLLEEDLTYLANEICSNYRATKFHLLAYKYICFKLGLKVLPQRRYAALSAVRAVYSDASFEWQRRLKIKPKKFVNFAQFPILDEKIKNLSEKIISIASQCQEPNFAWQGLLNYSITVLGLKIADKHKSKRFSSLIAGVLECLHDRFYEIEMAFYEDEQIIKNGDVF
ncbi:MAG: hypothetical protein HYV51_00275 [Parcubacteria group bacterium]|nr:hypothetical protein [Parcubacteria group bacterium]